MRPSLKIAVLDALYDMKALDVSTLAVSDITSITDHMIIATGTSTRHVKSIANALIKALKGHNYSALGIEGAKDSDWVLIDLGDIVVHVMLSDSREFYKLDKLWATFPTRKSEPVAMPA